MAPIGRRHSIFDPRRKTPLATTKAGKSSRNSVIINFTLQGGGSHGAFTWGALDRLLEEPWLQIDGISGTSAGPMNAAVLVDGHANVWESTFQRYRSLDVMRNAHTA